MIEIVAKPGLEMIEHVTANMREIDRVEVFATRWDDDPKAYARVLLPMNGFMWCAVRDDVPCALWGAVPVWPHHWIAFAFGTDDWARVVLTMTKHIRSFMLPALLRAKAYRVSAATHADHTEAHRWLESMGAVKEMDMPYYGKGGEVFFNYVWTKEPFALTLSKIPARKVDEDVRIAFG